MNQGDEYSLAGDKAAPVQSSDTARPPSLPPKPTTKPTNIPKRSPKSSTATSDKAPITVAPTPPKPTTTPAELQERPPRSSTATSTKAPTTVAPSPPKTTIPATSGTMSAASVNIPQSSPSTATPEAVVSSRTNMFSSSFSKSPRQAPKTAAVEARSSAGNATSITAQVLGSRTKSPRRATEPTAVVPRQNAPIFKDPLVHVNARIQELKECIESLGDEEAPFEKAIGELREVLSEKYFREQQSEAINELRAALPSLNNQQSPSVPAAAESPNSSSNDRLPSDDDTKSSQHSSQNTKSGSVSQVASVASSSPENITSPLPLNSSSEDNTNNTGGSPEKTTSASISPIDDSPHKEPPVPVLALTNKSANNSPEIAPPALYNLHDLFSDADIEKIAQENNLTENHPLLKPVNIAIFTVQRLQGQFKNVQRLLDPLTSIYQYYHQGREQLLKSKPGQERLKILALKAVAVSECRGYFYIDRDNKPDSGAKALDMMSRKDDGHPWKKNLFGNRPGGVHGKGKKKGYFKFNPYGGPFLELAFSRNMEFWYLLHANISTLSTGIKVAGAPLKIIADKPAPGLATMTTSTPHRKTIGRAGQVSVLVGGVDLQLVMESMGTLISWQNQYKGNENALIEHLTAVESISDDDYIAQLLDTVKAVDDDTFQILNSLHKESESLSILLQEAKKRAPKLIPIFLQRLWPKELLERSGKIGKELANLPQYIKLLPQIIRHYSPQNAMKPCPNIFRKLNRFNFSALVFANFPRDPSDLTGPNAKVLMIEGADESEYDYDFVIIDADQADEFPVIENNGAHYPTGKCIFYLMREAMMLPVDPEYREWYLSRPALARRLDFFSLIHKDDIRNRALIAQQAYTSNDLFEAVTQEQTAAKEPHSSNAPSNAFSRRLATIYTQAGKKPSLDLPHSVHPERFPLIGATEDRLTQALIDNSHLTHYEALCIARPEVAVYLDEVAVPLLSDDHPEIRDNPAVVGNPYNKLMEAFHRVTSNCPSYESAFLNKIITPIVQERLGDKFKPSFMDPLHQYKLLLKKEQEEAPVESAGKASAKATQKTAAAAKSYARLPEQDVEKAPGAPKRLATIDELLKNCRFPQLGVNNNGDIITLYDLIAHQNHKPDEHRSKASLAIDEAIKLYLEHLDFSIYIEKSTPALLQMLDTIGTELPFITLSRFTEAQRNHLIGCAAEAALPGAVKLLAKSFADLTVRNEFGETPLHALMRTHRSHKPKTVLSTLEACLKISTIDPELLNREQLTPLMVLVANTDKNPELIEPDIKDPQSVARKLTVTEGVIRLFRQHKTNLDQRVAFPRPGARNENVSFTALDYAIHLDNPAAVVALLNQGAGDLIQTQAAVLFAERHQSNSTLMQALELLKKLCPRFAYEYAIDQMTSATPDAEHPASCMIEGAFHGKRYLLKSVWDQLFDRKGDLINSNTVKEGRRVNIPLKINGKTMAFCKYLPELPARQAAYQIMHALYGSPCSTHSEFWRCDTAKGEKVFPLLMSNPISGWPLAQAIAEDAWRTGKLPPLHPRYWALLIHIDNILGKADAHAGQFIVDTIQTADELWSILVEVDPDQCVVPAFGKDGKPLIKNILFFLPQAQQESLNPQALATIICSNGKKLPTKAAELADINLLLRANTEQFVDEWASQCAEVEKRHLKLFPRNENALTMALTKTCKELDFSKTKLGQLVETWVDEEDRKKDKTLSLQQLNEATGFGKKFVNAATARFKKNYTTIDMGFDKIQVVKIFERLCQTTRMLYRLASKGDFNGLMLIGKTRRELYVRAYMPIISANSKLNALQKYEILKGGQSEKSTSLEIIASEGASRNNKNTGEWVTIDEAIEVYRESKMITGLKEIAAHEVSKGDTTLLQAGGTHAHAQREKILNSLIWVKGGKDNRAVLNTIRGLNIRLTHLKVHHCKEFTWDDLKALLQSSPLLETLDLTGCTGIKNSVLKLLAFYCPDVQKVILNETTITQLEGNCYDLPYLTHLETRNCPVLKSITLTDPAIKYFDHAGCESLETVTFDYNEHALERPLEEERPLKFYNIEGCKKLKAECIEAILACSPYLVEPRHKDNKLFNARAFVWFTLAQNRFNQRAFHAMLQHGKLDLYQLDFEDHHLQKFQEWINELQKPGAPPVITEVNFLGCTLLSRIKMFEFAIKTTRVVYGGPIRGDRRVGQFYKFDVGLDQAICSWGALPNGDILSLGERKDKKNKPLRTANYSIRSPQHADSKDITLGPDKDKFNGTVHSLMKDTDVISSAMMTNGLVLLSVRTGDSQNGLSQLILLDTITHKKVALEVPEATSLAGKLCVLNSTTFALHSDQFYIIKKGQFGWHVQHTAQGAVGITPIIKGPEGLVAYCVEEKPKRRIYVMNSETGHLVYNQLFDTDVVQALYFLDRERLMIFVGETPDEQYIATLNIKTQVLVKSNTVDASDHTAADLPEFSAIAAPAGEILVSNGGMGRLLDRHTLVRNGESIGGGADFPLISHRGDIVSLEKEGHLQMRRSKHFILDLSFRLKQSKGYQLKLVGEGSDRALVITTPEAIIAPVLDIDDQKGSYKIWCQKMVTKEATCTTFYELIDAFFEKWQLVREGINGKYISNVSYQGNQITIKGLSESESQSLVVILKSFLNASSPPTSPRERFGFNYREKPIPPMSHSSRRASQEIVSDEEAELSNEDARQEDLTLN